MVVLALVHGELDHEKTITTAVMAGIDVDCNGATVGSICGAAIGYDRLPQESPNLWPKAEISQFQKR